MSSFFNGVIEFYRWLFGPILQVVSKIRDWLSMESPNEQTPIVTAPLAEEGEPEKVGYVDEILSFYRWLVVGVWRAVTLPFRWLRRPSQSGSLLPGNPLRFRPDLWALEGDDKMAMDIRPTIIILPKPWLGLLSSSARRAARLSLIELLFLRVELHMDSKRLVYSTSWFWDRAGEMYVIDFVDMQIPEKVNLDGVVWSETILNLTVVKFMVKGSDKERRLLLPRRGMWWPTSLRRPTERPITAGPGYALMLKSLAGWANNGQWT